MEPPGTPELPEVYVAACRPVVWDEQYRRLTPLGLSETPVYPGSVQAACEGCGRAIWVGPRAQALEVPHRLLCFLCALAWQHASLGPTEVRNLGNPYQPR